MLIRSLAVALMLATVTSRADEPKVEHIVLVVLDGMRPDLVNEHDTPTLAALAKRGVFFQNNHSAYPSSTNVNGAVLATGALPFRNGIAGNQEYRPEINSSKPFDTADFPALEALDGRINASYLAMPTVAELLHREGFNTAIAGSKPVAQLFDRARTRSNPAARKSAVIYRGRIFSADWKEKVISALGPFPAEKGFPNEAVDTWTTRALTEVLWKEGVPKFSLLWLSEPDLTGHHSAPGSPLARLAMKSADEMLARVQAALEAKDVLTKTDIFVVSDHGFSTIDLAVDAAERLRAAGFDAVRAFPEKPKAGQILVVTLGGSIEFYVAQRDEKVIARLVDFLQHSDFAGVIFTHAAQEGAFRLEQAFVNSRYAPDVLVACRWNDQPNKYGVKGAIASDIGRVIGEGTHSTLSPHDMNNMLIAAGPDFRNGWKDETPSGNIDVAPTVLWLLGLKAPQRMDGRALREATVESRAPPAVAEKTVGAERPLGGTVWRQHLRTATVDGVTYLMEGNGGRSTAQP